MEKTISIQGRVNICSFATLARAYEHEKAGIRSKSDIIWRAVEELAWLYSRKHETTAFDSVADAIEYMDAAGLSLGTNPRARKTISRAASSEAYFKEVGEMPITKPMHVKDLPSDPPKEKSILEMSEEERMEAVRRTAAAMGLKVPTSTSAGQTKIVSSADPNDRAERERIEREKQKAAIQAMLLATERKEESDGTE